MEESDRALIAELIEELNRKPTQESQEPVEMVEVRKPEVSEIFEIPTPPPLPPLRTTTPPPTPPTAGATLADHLKRTVAQGESGEVLHRGLQGSFGSLELIKRKRRTRYKRTKASKRNDDFADVVASKLPAISEDSYYSSDNQSLIDESASEAEVEVELEVTTKEAVDVEKKPLNDVVEELKNEELQFKIDIASPVASAKSIASLHLISFQPEVVEEDVGGVKLELLPPPPPQPESSMEEEELPAPPDFLLKSDGVEEDSVEVVGPKISEVCLVPDAPEIFKHPEELGKVEVEATTELVDKMNSATEEIEGALIDLAEYAEMGRTETLEIVAEEEKPAPESQEIAEEKEFVGVETPNAVCLVPDAPEIIELPEAAAAAAAEELGKVEEDAEPVPEFEETLQQQQHPSPEPEAEIEDSPQLLQMGEVEESVGLQGLGRSESLKDLAVLEREMEAYHSSGEKFVPEMVEWEPEPKVEKATPIESSDSNSNLRPLQQEPHNPHHMVNPHFHPFVGGFPKFETQLELNSLIEIPKPPKVESNADVSQSTSKLEVIPDAAVSDDAAPNDAISDVAAQDAAAPDSVAAQDAAVPDDAISDVAVPEPGAPIAVTAEEPKTLEARATATAMPRSPLPASPTKVTPPSTLPPFQFQCASKFEPRPSAARSSYFDYVPSESESEHGCCGNLRRGRSKSKRTENNGAGTATTPKIRTPSLRQRISTSVASLFKK